MFWWSGLDNHSLAEDKPTWQRLISVRGRKFFFRQRTLLKQQKEFAHRNGLQYIDLQTGLHAASAGDEIKFYDIVHLSSAGNAMMARMIRAKLADGFVGGVRQSH